MAIFGVTLAPLMEEMFFRGLLYPDPGQIFRSGGRSAADRGSRLQVFTVRNSDYAWAPVLSIFVVGVVFTLVRVTDETRWQRRS